MRILQRYYEIVTIFTLTCVQVSTPCFISILQFWDTVLLFIKRVASILGVKLAPSNQKFCIRPCQLKPLVYFWCGDVARAGRFIAFLRPILVGQICRPNSWSCGGWVNSHSQHEFHILKGGPKNGTVFGTP